MHNAFRHAPNQSRTYAVFTDAAAADDDHVELSGLGLAENHLVRIAFQHFAFVGGPAGTANGGSGGGQRFRGARFDLVANRVDQRVGEVAAGQVVVIDRHQRLDDAAVTRGELAGNARGLHAVTGAVDRQQNLV